MNFWETVGGIFTGDTYFPDNVNRERRVSELVIDCKKLNSELAEISKVIKKDINELNNKLGVLYKGEKIPNDLKVTHVQFHQWGVEVAQIVAPLITFPVVSSALTVAGTSYLLSIGEIGAAGFASLVGLPILLSTAIAATAAAAAVAIVVGIGAVAGAIKRDKLRDAIHSYVPSRFTLQKAYEVNKRVSDDIKATIDAIDGILNMHIATGEALNKLKANIQSKLSKYESNRMAFEAKKSLQNLDKTRGSWITEDPDINIEYVYENEFVDNHIIDGWIQNPYEKLYNGFYFKPIEERVLKCIQAYELEINNKKFGKGTALRYSPEPDLRIKVNFYEYDGHQESHPRLNENIKVWAITKDDRKIKVIDKSIGALKPTITDIIKAHVLDKWIGNNTVHYHGFYFKTIDNNVYDDIEEYEIRVNDKKFGNGIAPKYSPDSDLKVKVNFFEYNGYAEKHPTENDKIEVWAILKRNVRIKVLSTKVGAMLTRVGWFQNNGEWYYFEKDGTLKRGWLQDGGKWYYFRKSDGAMFTNNLLTTNDGKIYCFGKDGIMKIGWTNFYAQWFYFEKDGSAKIGWFQDQGKWYYFCPEFQAVPGYGKGQMLLDTTQKIKTANGQYKEFHFNANGVCTNP
ncbi:N-acetylmuramoyl-L-alanine amidase family protein [Bacillus cereus]|uniref:N-acetylmuramoyl-L-alanine amidase family protein n=1 Tax=Bacillus cereus TaxID=1396 RepID=UPI0009D5607F|nr:hypothetical protein [Bacillus cereus]OPA04767.1 hypothetical protein BHL31_27925 [Bacillus cereus]HDR7762367.1 hypothetical protein [Bacillus cereus]